MVRAALMRPARGAALVLAMLVAALAAVVAIAVAAGQQRWFADVANRRDQVQAQALALAGVQWSRQIMQDDARSSSIDHLGEPWAYPLPRTPLENGSIEGSIEDAQGRLNINNLSSNDALGREEQARLTRLAAARGVAAATPAAVAAALMPPAADNGASKGSAQSPVASTSPATSPAPTPPGLRPVRAAELAALPGVSARDVGQLLPFVVALPAATPLNVNTASPVVLAAALPGLSADALAALIADRARKPFATLADFRSRLPGGATVPDETTLATGSSYFLVSVRARQGETRAQARALLRRDGREWPIVVWQTLE
jgi:general secretion pathway protein K